MVSVKWRNFGKVMGGSGKKIFTQGKKLKEKGKR